ncbi:uncharacterized protein METZ01_LOCUS165349 [marine metagenome]|jgi:prepilin-type N-terminal cleavage/methylation domain-containing protein|uniref:Type II secretion system protein GspG C-terminal domain-containing protein n=1 Tax=marine metagenome TaxID=408172 RepID=A0A382BFB2_9ZZZZ|tara:strand:- start:1391 stop:1891 length:501 start_codon:yes stop_codon:yes gene_type:complete
MGNYMKNHKHNNGFTLIELIMVMIILGILSAVAIPRYLETIEKSEIASQDAVITKLCAALENYAQHKMLTEGRRIWPTNPFDALETKPHTYTDDVNAVDADVDNEWTFVVEAWANGTGRITHQRADNTRWEWSYDSGVNSGSDVDVSGAVYERSPLDTRGTTILFE